MKKQHKVLNKISSWFNRHEYCKVFGILFILVFLCFLPHSLRNGLTLPVNGDYVLQQLHFYVEGYDTYWNFFKTGEFKMWSYEGFLGVNYVGANMFYYLTSPFIIPMLLFPRSLIPQAIFIMYLVKLSVGGLLFYILLRKYFKLNYKVCLLGAIIYSLSGWGMYYLWFNHFADVLAIFPLTLIGVEHCLQKKQGWLISLSFLLCGMINYYFFFSFVITSFLYAIFRYFVLFKKNKGYNLKIIAMGVIYFALGITSAGFVLITALKVITSMGRISDSSYLLTLLKFFFVDANKIDGEYVFTSLKSITEFFSNGNFTNFLKYMFVFSDRYVGSELIPTGETLLYPIAGLLCPPVNNWDTWVMSNVNFDNTISNFFISTPLVLLFIPAIIKLFKNKKRSIWKIIGLIFMIIIPFIPITYYVLNAFVLMYGRWQLFLVAALLLFTLPMVEKFDDIPKKHLDISFVICILLMAVLVYYSISIDKFVANGKGYTFFLYVAYFILVYLYIRNKCYGKGGFEKIFYVCLIEMIIMGNVTAFGQGIENYYSMYGGHDHLVEQQKIINELKEDDPTFYRVFDTLSDRSTNNLAMTLGYNSLSTFHSVYNYELDTFINDWSKISYSYYNWSMGVEEKRACLDTFLNVKYYILDKDDTNIPFGYTLYKEYEYYNVYVNNDYIELGYAFDSIIDINDITIYSDHYQIEPYYMRTAFIDHDDMDEISSILNDDIVVNKHTYGVYMPAFSSQPTYKLILNGTSEEIEVEDIRYATYELPEERKSNDETYYYTGDQIIVEYDEYGCKSASKENPCQVIVNFLYGPNVDIAFYNDDKLITHDDHGINYYSHTGDTKYGRGYYVDEPFNKIIIKFVSNSEASLVNREDFKVNCLYYNEYQYYINLLKDNKFEDIKVTDNTISFKTNYTDSKMIVLTVPYDQGWSLKVNGEEAKIYKVDEGFIGIIAPSGEITYELNYFTPGLKTGFKITLISFASILFVTALFNIVPIINFFKKDKKKKRRRKKKEEIVFGLFSDKVMREAILGKKKTKSKTKNKKTSSKMNKTNKTNKKKSTKKSNHNTRK